MIVRTTPSKSFKQVQPTANCYECCLADHHYQSIGPQESFQQKILEDKYHQQQKVDQKRNQKVLIKTPQNLNKNQQRDEAIGQILSSNHYLSHIDNKYPLHYSNRPIPQTSFQIHQSNISLNMNNRLVINSLSPVYKQKTNQQTNKFNRSIDMKFIHNPYVNKLQLLQKPKAFESRLSTPFKLFNRQIVQQSIPQQQLNVKLQNRDQDYLANQSWSDYLKLLEQYETLLRVREESHQMRQKYQLLNLQKQRLKGAIAWRQKQLDNLKEQFKIIVGP